MIITTAWLDGILLGSELRFMKGKASSGMEEGAFFLLQFSLLFDKLTVSNIHVFSCRIYGLRKYSSQLKGDDTIVKSI